MKKTLFVMAMLLCGATLFTGFAQEVFNPESFKYIAKEDETKEYTFIVTGQVRINDKWEHKKEKFVIIDKSLSSAQRKAREKFNRLYRGYEIRHNSITITCESTNNACQL